MTKFRLGVVIVLLALAYSSPTPLYAEQADADSRSDFRGATYLITVKTAAGAFESRVVITLHGDRTLSAIDSVQGGPTFFFTSQLGAWGRRRQGGRGWKDIGFRLPAERRCGAPGLYLHVQFRPHNGGGYHYTDELSAPR